MALLVKIVDLTLVPLELAASLTEFFHLLIVFVEEFIEVVDLILQVCVFLPGFLFQGHESLQNVLDAKKLIVEFRSQFILHVLEGIKEAGAAVIACWAV